MDPIVEQGFYCLLDVIKETKEKQQETADLIVKEDIQETVKSLFYNRVHTV